MDDRLPSIALGLNPIVPIHMQTVCGVEWLRQYILYQQFSGCSHPAETLRRRVGLPHAGSDGELLERVDPVGAGVEVFRFGARGSDALVGDPL